MESLILLWNDLVVFRTEPVWETRNREKKKHDKTGRRGEKIKGKGGKHAVQLRLGKCD